MTLFGDSDEDELSDNQGSFFYNLTLSFIVDIQ